MENISVKSRKYFIENISYKVENICTWLVVVALPCPRLSTPCLSTCICSPRPARCPSGRSSAGWAPGPPPSPSLWGTFAWKRERDVKERGERGGEYSWNNRLGWLSVWLYWLFLDILIGQHQITNTTQMLVLLHIITLQGGDKEDQENGRRCEETKLN